MKTKPILAVILCYFLATLVAGFLGVATTPSPAYADQNGPEPPASPPPPPDSGLEATSPEEPVVVDKVIETTKHSDVSLLLLVKLLAQGLL